MIRLDASDSNECVRLLPQCISYKELQLPDLWEKTQIRRGLDILQNVSRESRNMLGGLSCVEISRIFTSDLIAAELHAGEIISLDEQLNTIRQTGWVPFMYGCWQEAQKETLLWSLLRQISHTMMQPQGPRSKNIQ